MKTAYVAATSAYLLSACASSQAITGTDGREEHLMNCPGLALSWEECSRKAEEKCGGKGYKVVDRVKDADLVSTIPGQFTTAAQARVRWVKIRCGGRKP